MRYREPRDRGQAHQRWTKHLLPFSALTVIATCVATGLGLVPALRAAPGRVGAEDTTSAKLTYTRTLKGSTPEYLSVSVDSTGAGTYDAHKLDESPSPRSLKLSAATTRRLFELAAALNDFRSVDLESHKRVANLGLKTLTYEAGGAKYEAKFNYTLNRQAQDLADLFEKISAVEQHIAALEYAAKYDHLSLPHELLLIQIDLDNKALADPQLMVPTLDEIVRNPHFLHLAQVRAQDILDRVQSNN